VHYLFRLATQIYRPINYISPFPVAKAVANNVSSTDELGQSLLKMRNSLLAAREKEEQDRFINIRMAQIGQLLRTHDKNIDQLSVELIKNIVKYRQANQGGLFVAEREENPKIELKGCYAFDRIKYLQKSFAKGEVIAWSGNAGERYTLYD
jgi:hypothetical protein